MNIAKLYFKEFGAEQRPMAASVQSLKFCSELIKEQELNSILDSGSGLSSAVFHAAFNNVTTIDDSPFWAQKTRTFLETHLSKTINIDNSDSVQDQKFDFVFYDYGDIETRIYNFKKVTSLTDKLVYIDDLHVTYYRDYVVAKTKDHILKFLPETVDEYGRFGGLLVKRSFLYR